MATLTISDAARRCGVTRRTLQRAIRSGRLALTPDHRVTVTALLFSLMQGIFILHVETASTLMFWLVGGVNFADWHKIHMIWPWLAAGG